MKLFKGYVIVEGCKLEYFLYDEKFVIYIKDDVFDYYVVIGFIEFWGFLIKVNSIVKKKE